MHRKKLKISDIIITVLLILLALICVYPMWYTVMVSFSSRAAVEAGKVWIFPVDFTLRSYEKLLSDVTFFSSFFVSVKRVVVGCILNMIMLVLTAYPLCLPSDKFPMGVYYKWFFVANMLFNGGLIPSYMLMKEYELIGSFWSMILPSIVPLWNLILMINFFRNVPYELHEAAVVDGANPLRILFQIYVPVSVPSLSCMLLFQFLAHWNSYFDGLIYINDSKKQPLQTYIYQFSAKVDFSEMTAEEIIQALEMSDRTLAAGKVVIAMLPILIIYPLIQKYFLKGMLLGAVKG